MLEFALIKAATGASLDLNFSALTINLLYAVQILLQCIFSTIEQSNILQGLTSISHLSKGSLLAIYAIGYGTSYLEKFKYVTLWIEIIPSLYSFRLPNMLIRLIGEIEASSCR